MSVIPCSKINIYFEKRFSFERQNDWTLSSRHLVLNEDLWRIETFDLLKFELNETKSLLNDKGEKWQEHTSRINKSRLVIDAVKNKISPELLTQAWCKFYEVLSSYKFIPCNTENFKSLHLCEAPGGFISALHCYLYLNYPTVLWEWTANTLNPYYEGHNIKSVIVDDRLLFPTLKHWYFGKDNTGDITNSNYQNELRNFVEGTGLFDLVTADGSINCLENPAEQETIVAKLHFAEILVAITNLAPGGSFVLKKFTFFECSTICQMYLLNCIFKQVHVFKPFTSKHGNSEVYVICTDYLGLENFDVYMELFSQAYTSKQDKALFPLSSIPESFVSQLASCSQLFAELQKNAIQENIELYSKPLSSYEAEIDEVQIICAKEFLKKCNLLFPQSIPRLFRSKKQIRTSFYDKQNRNCKLMYFQAVGETYENLTKLKCMSQSDIVLDVEKRLNACFPVSSKQPREVIEWIYVWKEMFDRMKSKSYKNWIVTGKKMLNVENSKFCNPLLIHLWVRTLHETQVDIQNHQLNDCCHWDIEALLHLLEVKQTTKYCILSKPNQKDSTLKQDSLLSRLQQAFEHYHTCDFLNMEMEEMTCSENNRIFYINSTSWVDSLQQEIPIKNALVEILVAAIQVMTTGDVLVLCIQSLFTRYTVGLIFMVLSLFEKFVCICPNDTAPAMCGQLWVFSNYMKPFYTSTVIEHMKFISQLNVLQTEEILEIVPIASLCGGYFYEYLLSLNNKHLLRRLRKLTSIEKNVRS